MSDLIVLDGIELIPVVELEPAKFAVQSRLSPTGTSKDVPEEWHCYWTDSLADSGINGLRPIWQGSWHVPTSEFTDPVTLRRLLEVTFSEWGGIETLSDPDSKPVLNGGLALRCPASDMLIEPGCCADLSDAENWRIAASYRQAEWQTLWIGHPFLSVRYQSPWLIISALHESNSPTERWAVCPDKLQVALVAAVAELAQFACRVASILSVLGFGGDCDLMGRKLAGFDH